MFLSYFVHDASKLTSYTISIKLKKSKEFFYVNKLHCWRKLKWNRSWPHECVYNITCTLSQLKIRAVSGAIKMQKNRKLFLLAFCISLLLFYGIDSDSTRSEANLSAPPPYSVHIGVILYLNSPMGRMADACLSKAHSDFYAEYSDYKTRLFLQTINAEEELEVSSAGDILVIWVFE